MRVLYVLFITFFVSSITSNAQQAYKTETKSNIIKTLQVRTYGDAFSEPIIPINGDDLIEISFDVLHDSFQYYSYSIIHCDANWEQSSLTPIEYINGFNGLPLEDYALSMATTTQYTNYKLFLPNENIQFKVSGNYAVVIRSDDNPDQPIITACFSVIEPLINISAGITSNTDIDTNHSHQQVSFSINHPGLQIAYPQSDLKIKVYQNNREDNMATDLNPTSINNNRIIYDHIRELIFEAGNEYRRFEFLSNTYNGMRVEDVSFHNPFYHVTLHTDISRANQAYTYDQDQNGRIFINCSGCNESDTESDYNVVHFTLPSKRIPGGNVYLLSDIYNNILSDQSLMGYNSETGQYEKSILLKQGLYNYMYIFVPDKQHKGTTALLEGNYYQTENEYKIMVYYRPMGERYDRLIGVGKISNSATLL